MTANLRTFRLFLDESGHAGMGACVNSPSDRYLCIAAAAIERHVERQQLKANFNALKLKYFGVTNVPLHITDIANGKGAFKFLRNPTQRQSFEIDLLQAIVTVPHKVIISLIDKQQLQGNYRYPNNPYHYGVEVVMERFGLFLVGQNSVGDVMAESRNTNSDTILENEFDYWYQNKIFYNQTFNGPLNSVLTSKKLKFKKKYHCIAGLELADMYALSMKKCGLHYNPLTRTMAFGLHPQPAILHQIATLGIRQTMHTHPLGFIERAGYKRLP